MRRPSPATILVWIVVGVAAVAAIGIPFYEFVYKPVLAEIASSIVRQAGWLGQRPTDWNSAALATFVILTVAQVAVPCAAYLFAVAGITRRRRRGASIAIFGLAGGLGVFTVMMAGIRPRINPGLGSRMERFADRFDTYDPDVLAVLWETAAGPQVMLLCCGILTAVLAATTWRSGRARRTRAAWPWILPLPVIVLFAIAVQLTGTLTTAAA